MIAKIKISGRNWPIASISVVLCVVGGTPLESCGEPMGHWHQLQGGKRLTKTKSGHLANQVSTMSRNGPETAALRETPLPAYDPAKNPA